MRTEKMKWKRYEKRVEIVTEIFEGFVVKYMRKLATLI